MNSYVKAWIDIIVHGFVLLPWHIFEWVVSGFDSRAICLPIKRYWSMNGKNVNSNGKGFALPMGILEVLAALATIYCYTIYQSAANVANPVAYADAGQLLAPMADAPGSVAAVRHTDDFPEYLGNFVEERARHRFGYHASEALEFTMLDESLLNGIVSECDRAVAAGVDIDVTAASNFNGTKCNLITFSGNCVCAGKNSPEDLQSCTGFSDQKTVYDTESDSYVNDASIYGMCIKHGGLDMYIDTRDLFGRVATNEFWTFCELYLFTALLMSVMRAVARLLFPGELKKPGAMWVNGIPAGILMLMVRCRALSLFNSWKAVDSLNYFTESNYMFGHNPMMVWVETVPFVEHTNDAWGRFKLWAAVGAWLNIACSFFSDYSYCNDVTTLAYTKDNLKIVKERARKTKLASF